MNLLVNATHAIDYNGDITIRTWAEENSIKIAIPGTGCGIPPSDLTRIFDALLKLRLKDFASTGKILENSARFVP